MGKIIIHNNTSTITDELATKLVLKVMAKGRISNNGQSYCYVTTFGSPLVAVAAKRNSSNSDTFWVTENAGEGK